MDSSKAEIAKVMNAVAEPWEQKADLDTANKPAIGTSLFLVSVICYFFVSLMVLKRASGHSGEGRKENDHEVQQVTYRGVLVGHISSIVDRRFLHQLLATTHLHTFHRSIPTLIRHLLHSPRPLHRNSSSHIHPQCHPLGHRNLHNLWEDVIGNVDNTMAITDRCHNKESLLATFKPQQVYIYVKLRIKVDDQKHF